ncbi:MAG: hypothetical protein Q4F84_00245 [Fibrobacter sp.]|nr:hypothetical protein [Fibrobacter sp.]
MDRNESEFHKTKSETKSEINESIRQQGNRLINSGKAITVNELSKLGKAFHAAANTLHEQNGKFANIADMAAKHVDSIKDYFDKREPETIVKDVHKFSKRNLYLTVGSMFIAGAAISRFLKSGSGR